MSQGQQTPSAETTPVVEVEKFDYLIIDLYDDEVIRIPSTNFIEMCMEVRKIVTRNSAVPVSDGIVMAKCHEMVNEGIFNWDNMLLFAYCHDRVAKAEALGDDIGHEANDDDDSVLE